MIVTQAIGLVRGDLADALFVNSLAPFTIKGTKSPLQSINHIWSDVPDDVAPFLHHLTDAVRNILFPETFHVHS